MGIYLIKNNEVLISKFYVSSNIANWVLSYLKIFSKELGMTDNEMVTFYLNLKHQYHMQDNKFMLMLFGGSLILTFFLLYFLLGLGGKPPKNLYEYEPEGIIYTKRDAVIAIRSSVNYKVTTAFILLTEKRIIIFMFGKKILELPREKIEYNKKRTKMILRGKNYQIRTKSIDILSAN